MEEILNIKQLSARLDKDEKWIRANYHRFPHMRLGRDVRFCLSHVIEYLEKDVEREQLSIKEGWNDEYREELRKTPTGYERGINGVSTGYQRGTNVEPENLPPIKSVTPSLSDSPNPRDIYTPPLKSKNKRFSRKVYSSGYEKLFKDYPNKRNKWEGFVVYESVESQLPPEDELLEILRQQVNHPPFEGYTFPFIQKWLRKFRWEDDLTSIRGPTSKSAAMLELEAIKNSKKTEEIHE